MPQLPDLRAKLALDFPNVAAATAQAALLGQALQRELGGTRGAEIDRSMKQIGASVEDTGRRLQNAGTAFVKWGDAGQVASLRISSSTAKTKADFTELDKRTRELGNSLDTEFKKGTSAVIRLGEDGSAALGDVSRQIAATGTASTQAAGGLLSMGTAGAALVAVGVALAAYLSPVVAILGAFTVGLAATVTVAGLALAGIGALAVAIVVLAAATQHWTGVTQTVPAAQQAVANATLAHQSAVLALHTVQTNYNATSTHTAAQTLALQQAQQKVTDTTNALTKAQQDLTAAQTAAHNPLQQLKKDAGDMANTLGQQAAPMASQLLLWLDKLIPTVTTLGQSLLTWFGERLPGILQGASVGSKILTDRLSDLGTVIGHFLDQAGLRSPQLMAFFDLLLKVGIDAINGLLTNLLRLSDWFLERLPKFEPIIGQIFGALGTTVQALGTAFGKFVDWVFANWPSIVWTLDQTWKHFQEGYRLIKPLLDNFHKDMQELAPLINFITQNSSNLVPVLQALGVAFGLVVAIIEAVIVIAVVLAAAIVAVATVITNLVNGIKIQLPQAGAQFSALGQAGRDMQHDLGGVTGAIGAAFDVLGKAIHSIAVGSGQDFSTLGTAGRQMQTDLGRFFGAIGAAFHQLGINVQAEVRSGGAQFSALGAAAQTAQRDIGRAFSAIGSAAHDMVGGVGSAFSGLGGTIHGGLDSARGVFNNFAHRVNGVLGAFKITIGDIQPFAQGGVVPGYAPGQDSVPALLSPGEGVLTPQTVRGLGGSGAIDLLNRAGSGIHGLGALVANDVGALGSLVGSIAGQCVVAVEKWTGHYFPVAMASQMTRWINSATAAAGEIFVSTLPPFGHTGIVLPGGMVIDSNWGLDERVRIHPLRDIPSIAGYIAGIPTDLGSLAGLALPSLGTILKDLIAPLVGAAHSAAGLIPEAWARPLATGLIDKIAANVAGRQFGGPVIPGHLYAVGEGGPELFSPGVPGQVMPAGVGGTARVEALLTQAVALLQHIDGTPGLDAGSASRRYAT